MRFVSRHVISHVRVIIDGRGIKDATVDRRITLTGSKRKKSLSSTALISIIIYPRSHPGRLGSSAELVGSYNIPLSGIDKEFAMRMLFTEGGG